MKQFERKVGYTYRWWSEGGDVQVRDVEELDRHARSVVGIRMEKGYVNGSLPADIEGRVYRGYWEDTGD